MHDVAVTRNYLVVVQGPIVTDQTPYIMGQVRPTELEALSQQCHGPHVHSTRPGFPSILAV